jgi:hypothetical protein
MEINKVTKRINQKKQKDESGVSVNLITRLTSDANYL